MALKIVTDTFTTSILAVRTWQDIWSRCFSEEDLRFTLENIIQAELKRLNADFGAHVAKYGLNLRWVAQEELWRQIQCQNPIWHSRLIPILLNHKDDIAEGETSEEQRNSFHYQGDLVKKIAFSQEYMLAMEENTKMSATADTRRLQQSASSSVMLQNGNFQDNKKLRQQLSESRQEFDAISCMVVDKVFDRIKSSQEMKAADGEHSKNHNVKMSAAKNQHMINQEKNLISELQASVCYERLKVMEWMKKLNEEKQAVKELQSLASEMQGKIDELEEQHSQDKKEIQRLVAMSEAEKSSARALETALLAEKDNFLRLKMTLDAERSQSREAIERNNETILDLRTALEIEREKRQASMHNLMPSIGASREAIPMMLTNESSNAKMDQLRDEMEHLYSELQSEKCQKEELLATRCCFCQQNSDHPSTRILDSIVGKNEFLQEFSHFYARKLETEQLHSQKLQNTIERLENQIVKLDSDKEVLRNQLQLMSAPNEGFERFYIEELEAKLDAHRQNESKLANDLDIAKMIVHDLQMENKEFLHRERKLVSELEFLQEQANCNDVNNGSVTSKDVRLSSLLTANEVLKSKIRLLERKLERQDSEQNNASFDIIIPKNAAKKSEKPGTKLRIWKLERQKKCLVWQKKYLQALLHSLEGNLCKNGCNNCIQQQTSTSSESYSMSSSGESSQKKVATKGSRKSFRVIAQAVIAAVRIRRSAESWRKMQKQMAINNSMSISPPTKKEAEKIMN